MKKRLLATLLALCLVMAMVPVTALAEGTEVSDAADLAAAIATGGNIKLGADITVTEGLVVSYGSVTLDLNGHKLQGLIVSESEFVGVITVKGGSLTIDDSSNNNAGEVRGGMFAVAVQSGSLTINGGTYGAASDLTGWSGKNWYEPLLVLNDGVGVVNDGVFVDGALEYYNAIGTETGSLTVNGGKFDSLPYFAASNQGADIFAPSETDNLMIAYSTYGDFASANSTCFSYDSTTKTLKLLADYNGKITETGDVCGFYLNSDVTIDLNGHVWDLKTTESYPYAISEIVINDGVTVTLTDGSDTAAGAIQNSTGSVIEVMGTLNIAGGTVEQNGWSVMSATILLDGDGTVNMTEGTVGGNWGAFKVQQEDRGTEGTQRILISGGTVTGSINLNDRESASCEITGGTFNKAVDEAYCADEYLPRVNEDGSYTVVKGDTKVASVTDSAGNVKEYVSLGKALAAAGDGDTVTLLDDVVLPGTVTTTGNLTLDLAGRTITKSGKSGSITVGAGGVLTIKDSQGNGTINDVLVKCNNGSELNFESGTIDNSTVNGIVIGSKQDTDAGTKVTVSGGVVKGKTNGITEYIGTLTITGGTIEGGTTGVAVGYGGSTGNYRASATATVSGDAVITGGTNGIDVLGPASKLTVNSGSITGTTGNGINAASGGADVEVVINAGSITGGEYGAYWAGSNNGKFEINAGNFVGGTAAVTPAYWNSVMTVSGGSFSSDPSKYVADNGSANIVRQNSDSSYTVLAKSGLTSGIYLNDPSGATAANYYVSDNGDGTWTVYYVAPYVPSTPSTPDTPDALPFVDIGAGHTFRPYIEYVYEHGIMNGRGDRFDAATPLSRVQLVTTLYRMAGSPVVSGALPFSDTDDLNAEFTRAVQWAAANGVVGGYEDGTFRPYDPVSRQAMMTILYRYANSRGFNTAASVDRLDAFTDAEQVSAKMTSAVNWAVDRGFVGGNNGYLNPGGSTSRGAAAKILAGFHQAYFG